MKIIENDNCIFFDCDDTLVMWDNKYKNEDNSNCLKFDCYGLTFLLVPHLEHIQYLKDCKLKNYNSIIVWSAGGWEWAKEVVRVLELEGYVDAVMSKPSQYVDDLLANDFMGIRVYKDIK